MNYPTDTQLNGPLASVSRHDIAMTEQVTARSQLYREPFLPVPPSRKEAPALLEPVKAYQWCGGQLALLWESWEEQRRADRFLAGGALLGFRHMPTGQYMAFLCDRSLPQVPLEFLPAYAGRENGIGATVEPRHHGPTLSTAEESNPSVAPNYIAPQHG